MNLVGQQMESIVKVGLKKFLFLIFQKNRHDLRIKISVLNTTCNEFKLYIISIVLEYCIMNNSFISTQHTLYN